MLVYKFGGTSVGSVQNMNHAKEIIQGGGQKLVVLSAMSGTTNALVKLSQTIADGDRESAIIQLHQLNESYQTTVYELLHDQPLRQETSAYVNAIFQTLTDAVAVPHSQLLHNTIVAQGELLSTYMFSRFLQQEGHSVVLLPALEFMRIDRMNEPDNFYIQQNLRRLIAQQPKADFYITQGFICLDAEGKIANLQRGGSDYTATIIGAAINAQEVQIWTDIDGFHNNDPRHVHHTQSLSH